MVYMGVLLRPGIIAILSGLGHRLVCKATGTSGNGEIVLLAVELVLAWGLIVVIEKRKIAEDARYLRTIMAAYGG
jgi:hypothetical protein